MPVDRALTIQRLQHRLVAAHFHVSGGRHECEPDQRIEPVYGQGKKGQQLPNVVTAFAVPAPPKGEPSGAQRSGSPVSAPAARGRPSSVTASPCHLPAGEGFGGAIDLNRASDSKKRAAGGRLLRSPFHSASCQSLQTSTQPSKREYRSSSAIVSSMALLLLPQAGKTVSNRLSDSSR